MSSVRSQSQVLSLANVHHNLFKLRMSSLYGEVWEWDVSKVVFWLGPAVGRTFDFATALGTGIGGSETAAIHLSRCLAALGHDVDVYADVTSPAAWSDFVT